jgi:hypothetical protein
MRAQVADLIGIELNICMAPKDAIDLLGIAPGDRVVLEGDVTNRGSVRQTQLRAQVAPEGMVTQRMQLSGGGFESRFPSARDALGVYPDLPPLFVDAATRDRLKIGPLSPVRVRADRSFQAFKEIRELLILVAVASIGIIAAVNSPWARAAIGSAVYAVGALVLIKRLRDRLGVQRAKQGPA